MARGLEAFAALTGYEAVSKDAKDVRGQKLFLANAEYRVTSKPGKLFFTFFNTQSQTWPSVGDFRTVSIISSCVTPAAVSHMPSNPLPKLGW